MRAGERLYLYAVRSEEGAGGVCDEASRSVFARIRRGESVLDAEFDRVFPEAIGDASRTHWTQVERCLTGARMLASRGARTVLDVGSGAGKFALVAACAQPSLVVTGVEHRGYLVALSNALARAFEVGNARFEEGDALARDWSPYDAVYLYNPFVENLFHPSIRVDREVSLGGERYVREVAEARARLCTMAEGALLLTFHGYGADVPSPWESVERAVSSDGVLELWQRQG